MFGKFRGLAVLRSLLYLSLASQAQTIIRVGAGVSAEDKAKLHRVP
jgi:hypothetical protein